MNRTAVAEWMLVRRFGAERADEIAGDLLEQYKPARANWEMVRMALAIRGVELAGLLLVSLLLVMLSSALYSPWKLRFMAVQEDLHVGWAWSMSALLGGLSFAGWLATASSALRLGARHSITRSCFLLSVTLAVLSVFMLQPELRRIAPVILAGVILWRLRSTGAAATFSAVAAIGAVLGCFRLLSPTVGLTELRTCLVQMHTRGLQPAWWSFYSACTPLAVHEWLIWFISTLMVYWLVTFLPSPPSPTRHSPSASPGR